MGKTGKVCVSILSLVLARILEFAFITRLTIVVPNFVKVLINIYMRNPAMK